MAASFFPLKTKTAKIWKPPDHCQIKLCNWTPAERNSNQRDSIRHLSSLSFRSLVSIQLSSSSPPQPHSKYQWGPQHPRHWSWTFKKVAEYPLPNLQEHWPEWMLWNHTGVCCPLNYTMGSGLCSHTTSINPIRRVSLYCWGSKEKNI